MSKINLLPWREELRETRKKSFVLISSAVAVVGIVLTAGVWSYFDHALTDQLKANQLIIDNNTQVDAKLKALDGLQEQKKAIVARMGLIQDLQGQRPVTVRIVDELVHVIPKHVFLQKLSRDGDMFVLDGKAENPDAVAEMMRSMENSLWFRNVFMSSFITSTEKDNQQTAQKMSILPREEEKYGTFMVTANLDKIAQKNVDESVEASVQGGSAQ
ncbi:PilN domain-containing protein [Acinetobacter apis]|uniref:Type IV pilus assembly protein PilN n=1 Tax=Acinetobacter apis TaxID=1229165 RepID=A0A217EGY2_9GAMM|nr:PilN domain-containing protein [Acinetobacter apis]SNQ29761.1 type IV pilus assembly protein PilN [Acinetobacter apis]